MHLGKKLLTWTKRREYLKWLFLSLAVSAFLRLPYFQYDFIFVDEAWWANGAKALFQGKQLYSDIALDKNPPIFWLCAALFKIFGVHMAAIHWGALFLVGTVSALLCLMGRRFFGASSASAALVYAFASTTYYIPRIIGMNTETLMAFFSTAAVFAYLHGLSTRRRPYSFLSASGFLSCWACFTKPVAITETAFLVLYLLLGRSHDRGLKLRLLAAFCIGIAAAAAMFFSYLAATGILHPWWDQVVLFGLRYIRRIDTAAFLLKSLRANIAFVIIFTWLFILIWYSYRMRSQNRRIYDFTVLWALSSFIGVVIGRRYYANYFLQIIPPLSLLAGIGFAYLLENPQLSRSARSWKALGVAFLASALWFHSRTLAGWLSLAVPAVQEIRLWDMGAKNRKNREISEYLRQNTSALDTIFIWGSNPEVYFLCPREMATKWLLFDVADDYPPGAGELQTQIHAAQILVTKKPRYIIDVQQSARMEKFSAFYNLIANHYRLERQIDGARLFRLH